MKASVYIATSLDGMIARPNGDLDWLSSGEAQAGEDYGYQAFIDTVDVLVMGRATFEKALTFEAWPYTGKRVVVLSSRHIQLPEHIPASVRVMAAPPAELVARLAEEGAAHLYVDGGQTIQRFLRAGLITDLIVTRIPILIGAGIPLFGALDRDVALTHVETRAFANGFVQSHYRVTGG
jgi:dihydrofolate reductase